MKTSPLFENPDFVARGDELVSMFQEVQCSLGTVAVADVIRDVVAARSITREGLPYLDQASRAEVGYQALAAYFSGGGKAEESVEKIHRFLESFHGHPIALESTNGKAIHYDGVLAQHPIHAAQGYVWEGGYAGNRLYVNKHAGSRRWYVRAQYRAKLFDEKIDRP